MAVMLLGAGGYLLWLRIAQSVGGKERRNIDRLKALLPSNRQKSLFAMNLTRLYPALASTIGTRYILNQVRRRLQVIYVGNDQLIRPKATLYTLYTVGIAVVVTLLSMVLASTIYGIFSIIMAGLFIGSTLTSMLVRGLEKKLLYELVNMLNSLKDHYQQTKMIVESLNQVSDTVSSVVATHSRRIADILTALDPQEELQRYYEVVPNRYLRQFAGISYTVFYYGDSTDGEKSIYLNGLARIIADIRMDILRREKLDYQLMGLIFMTLVPVFCLEPLKIWAVQRFTDVSSFYESQWGVYALAFSYFTIVACFFGMQILSDVNDEGNSLSNEGKFCRWLLKKKWISKIITRVAPSAGRKEIKANLVIREANSRLTVREFYVKKVISSLLIFVLTFSVQCYGHVVTKEFYYAPPLGDTSTMSKTEVLLSNERMEFEKKIIISIVEKQIPPSQIPAYIIEQATGKRFIPKGIPIETYATTFTERVINYQSEYLKWYDWLIAFVAALLAFKIPDIMLLARGSVRKWEMQNEVDGFYSIVGMLCGIERIMVYEILEWMHRYSSIFAVSLSKCTMNYESGPLEALEEFKEDSKFPPLERIVERLKNSVERIPVKDAFDDLGEEREHAAEERKLEYEKMVTYRVTVGKWIGFAPMSVVVAMYLLAPFCYIAVKQFSDVSKVMGGIMAGG
jgi:hypothetical protein